MSEPVTLTICLGSSCFTRGNGENLQRIQAWIREGGLEGRVVLRGARCEGRCQEGPNLRVGEAFLDDLRSDTLVERLEQLL
jgi:NADH:ubiquinone oxidoreductase subunit E